MARVVGKLQLTVLGLRGGVLVEVRWVCGAKAGFSINWVRVNPGAGADSLILAQCLLV